MDDFKIFIFLSIGQATNNGAKKDVFLWGIQKSGIKKIFTSRNRDSYFHGFRNYCI